MNKYYWAARNTWEETLTYRFNFLMWRVRNVVLILSLYFLWFSVIPENSRVFGYDQSSILTYVLGTSLISAIVTSNRSYAIGDEINQGNLSNYLIKPMNYFLYWFSRDIGDKLMNLFFSIGEIVLIYLIFHPPLVMQTNPVIILLFIFSVILAVILYFLMNLLLGFVGFWSADVWAPRFIFWVVLSFFAGNYFPLDILSPSIYRIFELLPFSYLIFFPIKVYLGQIVMFDIMKGFMITGFWIILLFILSRLIWSKGLRAYTAQGR